MTSVPPDSSKADQPNRRRFITSAASGLALGGVAGCVKAEQGPAVSSGQTVGWRLASAFTSSLDTIYGAAETLAAQVEGLSGGRFKIDVNASGELTDLSGIFDGVRNNNFELGHTASYYYRGKSNAFAFDTSVPFGLTARQQQAWLSEAGGGLALMRELFSDFNIVNFPGGNTGAQMGGWFKKPFANLAEMQGLKMRIPGLGGEVMNRLGVTAITYGAADIFPALEKGAIDATEWVGPYDDMKLGFHKIAKHYYYPGWWEPGPGLSFYVNKDAWNKLSPTNKEIFTSAAAVASAEMMYKYDAKNPAALAELKQSDVTLHEYPADVLKKGQEIMAEMHAEFAEADPQYARIFKAWDAYRKQSNAWFATTELAYSASAFGDS